MLTCNGSVWYLSGIDSFAGDMKGKDGHYSMLSFVGDGCLFFSRQRGLIVLSFSMLQFFFYLRGYFGAASCIILSNWGAAWGTWKSGLGLCGMAVNHPQGVIKNLVAIIMAGVLGIYGLIVSIIIAGAISAPSNENGINTYSQYNGWAHLAAGLCCGLSCLASGGATGVAGEVGIRATGLRAELNHAKTSALTGGSGAQVVDEGDAGKMYIGSVMILSFAGAIGLYGLIVALIITSSSQYYCE